MSADPLTPEAKRENAIALAAALGIHVEEAATSLDLFVLVTADAHDPVAQQLVFEVQALLARTVRCGAKISDGERVAAELVVGSGRPQTSAPRVYVELLVDRAVIGPDVRPAASCAEVPPILALLVACYASAATLRHALCGALPFGGHEPLVVDFAQLGVEVPALMRPLELERAYLAGAGAIGNGLLWAARHLDIRGQLVIADDDQVAPGNLNRQIWFGSHDIGKYKVARLVAHAQPQLPRLELVPRPSRLQDLREKGQGAWLEKLIVAVDSRRARRALQNEFPGEVFDASTTDIREVVVYHHRQPTDAACLSCIYEPDEEEYSREQHIAEHFGVGVEAVRGERISEDAARIVARKFPGVVAAELVGTAYDSLFKRLCAESALRSQEGKRVIAPFAFVSVLAGTMLALELVRHHVDGPPPSDNYWRVSPWHPPFARRRTLRPRQPNCAFCAQPILRRVNESLWIGRP